MLQVLLNLLTGPLVNGIIEVIKKQQDVKINEDALRAQISQKILETLSSITDDQKQVVLAELQSESWLNRNWRSLFMTSCASILIFFGFIEPVMVAWADVKMVQPDKKVLDWIYNLTTVGVGGYVGHSALQVIADVLKTWRK